MIKRNAAKCAKCGTVIESTHRHDFVTHACDGVYFFVDGGKSYLRRGWGGPNLSQNPDDHFVDEAIEYQPDGV